MAIQGNISLVDNFNVTVLLEGVYVRVQQVESTKAQTNAFVTFYRSPEDVAPIANKVYSFAHNLTGGNFIAQAYGYLKSLPEFSAVADC